MSYLFVITLLSCLIVVSISEVTSNSEELQNLKKYTSYIFTRNPIIITDFVKFEERLKKLNDAYREGKLKGSDQKENWIATCVRLSNTKDCTVNNYREFEQASKDAAAKGYWRMSAFLKHILRAFDRRCYQEWIFFDEDCT